MPNADSFGGGKMKQRTKDEVITHPQVHCFNKQIRYDEYFN
jgi:hypothetical protein